MDEKLIENFLFKYTTSARKCVDALQTHERCLKGEKNETSVKRVQPKYIIGDDVEKSIKH